MKLIIVASVLAFLLITYIILCITDGAWWAVGAFWGFASVIALIVFLFATRANQMGWS